MPAINSAVNAGMGDYADATTNDLARYFTDYLQSLIDVDESEHAPVNIDALGREPSSPNLIWLELPNGSTVRISVSVEMDD